MFRDLIVDLTEIARSDSVSIAIGKMLDRSGYLQDLREERSEDAEARIENLAELVSAAREYESREPEPSLGGFVDRLSLLSDVDEEQGTRDARIWLMTLHSAKGLEFPIVILAGLEEGLFPHSRSSEDEEELEEERRLCYVGMTRARRAAGADRRGAAPRLRRVPGERAVALHRRGAGGARRTRRRRRSRRRPTRATSRTTIPDQPVRPRRRGGRAREERRRYAYEDEDQSTGHGAAAGHEGAAPAVRRRHRPQRRGAGRRHEAGRAVRAVGQKTLRAKFAKLEPA